MRKKMLFFLSLIVAVITLFLSHKKFEFRESFYEPNFEERYEEEYEESEEEIAYEMALEESALPTQFDVSNLQGDELESYNNHFKNLEASNFTFSTKEDFLNYAKAAKNNKKPLFSKEYSYANGTLTGIWDQKYLHMSSNVGPGYSEGGFRTDGSLYDPVNDEMYVVSFAGHIYKINENAPIKWSVRNQSKSFKGDKFNGVNLSDGSFRMLHQNGTGPMEYSDDEGRTWINANGAYFQSNANYTTLVAKKGTSKRIVAHGARRDPTRANAWYDFVYISTDYGLNYSTSLSFRSNAFDVEIVKPHSSQSVYLLAKRNSDLKLFVYKMAENDADFSLLHEVDSSISKLDALHATTVNDTTHFYISYNNIKIFYSGDEGATWSEKITSNNTGRNITEVHPTKPNVVFKGFVELWISNDYGVTWTKNNHRLSNNDIYVWDLQHFKTYDKEDGTFLTISGYDFGTYYSTTSDDWNSWVSISKGNPTIMCYDADTSEKYRKIYTANQDRGSQSFVDDPNHDTTQPIPAAREANTDLLRVTIANDGESAWYWYYYGAIGRSAVTAGGNFRTVVVQRNLYARWAATNMVSSPDQTEDAVYIAWGRKLHKLSFDGTKIERTFHSFSFPETTESFGYSNVNKNRWYVGLKSGSFMYSEDGGNTFFSGTYSGSWPISEGSHRKRRTVIATSPTDEATVYYAGRGNVFLISTDGGKTFTNHNNGLLVSRITDLEASSNGQFIFAACEFDGAWVYSVQQDMWFKMSGEDVPDALGYTDVQFIESDNLVRFATYGSGILDFTMSTDVATVFLAPSNFKIQTVNETCSGKNGQLKINTTFNHKYNVEISGTNYNFTNTLTVKSLQPKDYTVCVGIDETSYKHCFEVQIKPSLVLSGKFTSVNKNTLQFKTNSGTAPFKVFVNHQQRFETSEKSFTVTANKGDFIEIESKATCEGKISKKMGSKIEFKAFPNPATEFIEINLPEKVGNAVGASLFSINSKLIFNKQFPVVNGKIVIDVRTQAAGIYFIKLNIKETETIKILKR